MAGSKSSTPKSQGKPAGTVTDETTAGPATTAEKSDTMKMKGFIELVSTALVGTKKTTRDVVAATLAALGTTLKAGESFNLPPLGRGRVVKQTDGVITLKLRQGPGTKSDGGAAKEALAATEE